MNRTAALLAGSLALVSSSLARAQTHVALKPNFEPNPTAMSGVNARASVPFAQLTAQWAAGDTRQKCGGFWSAQPIAIIDSSAPHDVRLSLAGADVLVRAGQTYWCSSEAQPLTMDVIAYGAAEVYVGAPTSGAAISGALTIEDYAPTEKEELRPFCAAREGGARAAIARAMVCPRHREDEAAWKLGWIALDDATDDALAPAAVVAYCAGANDDSYFDWRLCSQDLARLDDAKLQAAIAQYPRSVRARI